MKTRYRGPVVYVATCDSKLGPMTAGYMNNLLIYLGFEPYATRVCDLVAAHIENPWIVKGRRCEYKRLGTIIEKLENNKRQRHFQMNAMGTPFQKRVWAQLLHIPLGETRTYKQLAEAIGEPGKYRAVARACGANPIAVLIPCHRIVQTNGQLGGYYWGTELKTELLAMEMRQARAIAKNKRR